jgi:hypothetical protein
MGSYRYAQRSRERGERITAMLSLEALGYFNDAPRSQQYPAMLDAVFPDRANFIAFASNVGSQRLLRRCMSVFRTSAAIPFLAKSRDPVQVMAALNDRLCHDLQRREFVAMALAHFDPETGVATLVNAGMPDPLLLRRDGSVDVIASSGDRFPLGVRQSVRYEASSFKLERGDRMLMYSDGLAEASLNGEPIGYDRVRELAVECETVEELIAAVRAGAQIDDDATGVVIRHSPDREQPAATLQRLA